jgi:hypothetical protein
MDAQHTAAGVSAGIDLALWLADEIAGRPRTEAMQLAIEYDPHRLVPKIAWLRLIDLIRTGK